MTERDLRHGCAELAPSGRPARTANRDGPGDARASGVKGDAMIGGSRALRAVLLAVLPLSARSDGGGHVLRHEWQLVNGEHWQIISSGGEDASVTDEAEGTRGACAPGMVKAAGRMKVDGWGYADEIDALQQTTCVDWIDRQFPERCARFDRGRWLTESERVQTREMGFCIDRFEYPNRRGAFPIDLSVVPQGKFLWGKTTVLGTATPSFVARQFSKNLSSADAQKGSLRTCVPQSTSFFRKVR